MQSSLLRIALAAAVLMASTSCEEIGAKLSELRDGGAPVALPETESLAGFKYLPRVTAFASIEADSFQSFVKPADRISVVKFYSDT